MTQNKRQYQLIDRRRGKVFVLTQWAEYALYELGGALLDPENHREEIESYISENHLEKWEFDALVAFAKENADKYRLFNGDMARVIELENGRYALSDGEYMSDWSEEDRDVEFLEAYKECPHRRVYLPSALLFAARR